jgi:hypothetical protein
VTLPLRLDVSGRPVSGVPRSVAQVPAHRPEVARPVLRPCPFLTICVRVVVGVPHGGDVLGPAVAPRRCRSSLGVACESRGLCAEGAVDEAVQLRALGPAGGLDSHPLGEGADVEGQVGWVAVGG